MSDGADQQTLIVAAARRYTGVVVGAVAALGIMQIAPTASPQNNQFVQIDSGNVFVPITQPLQVSTTAVPTTTSSTTTIARAVTTTTAVPRPTNPPLPRTGPAPTTTTTQAPTTTSTTTTTTTTTTPPPECEVTIPVLGVCPP